MSRAAPVATVWACPSVAMPGTPWCAVVSRDGRSVVTACRGRWEADAGDELSWFVQARDACKGCLREHAATIERAAPVAERDAPQDRAARALRARGLRAHLGALLGDMTLEELRVIDGACVEVMRRRRDHDTNEQEAG